MNSDREMGMAVMTALSLVVVVIILSMCSCGSKKTVTDTVVIHDTLRSYHTDTVIVTQRLTHHDTLRVETERVVTLVRDTVGKIDTVRVESSTIHWQHTADINTESRLVSKVDSILRAMDARHDKEKVTTRIPTEYWGYALFLMVCFGICLWLLVRIKR